MWRNLSQDELDWAYDQTQHAANMQAVLQACAERSTEVRATLTAKGLPADRLAYGELPDEMLDWYASVTSVTPAKALVFFIHGGAWRRGLAKENALGIEWMLAAGIQVVIPDFSSVLQTNGQLQPMLDQITKAFLFAANKARPATPIIICGHSSGAHLAACLITQLAALNETSSINGLVLCSGLFDLEPVSRSSRSNYVQFSENTISKLSPINSPKAFKLPVRIICGTNESPEFMRQSKDFASVLKQEGTEVTLTWGKNLNHFEILQTLDLLDGQFSIEIATLFGVLTETKTT